jgi:hypothetical protein
MGAIRTIGAALGRTIGTALGRTIRTILGRTIGTTYRRAGLADVDSLEGCGKGSAEPFAEILISGEGRLVGRVHVYREIIIACSQLRHTEDMVEMSMSQHDTYRLEASG